MAAATLPLLDGSERSDPHVNATIRQLFDYLSLEPARTDIEIGRLLQIEIDLLRDRLEDLKRRGILANPSKAPLGWIWTSRFSTSADGQAAAASSGLAPEASIVRQRSWWNLPTKKALGSPADQERR